MDEYAGKEIEITYCFNYYKGITKYSNFRPKSIHKIMKAPPGKTNSRWFVWVRGSNSEPSIILAWEYKFYHESRRTKFKK